MGKKTYELGKKTPRKNVGKKCKIVFSKTLKKFSTYSSKQNKFNFILSELPETKLDYLKLLTDDVGIFQHTNLGVPSRHHGYSTDDVGRALVALTQLINSVERTEDILKLITTYMSFLEHAQTDTGHFHNFMSYNRKFLDEKGSEDTLERAIYGLDHVISCPHLPKNVLTLARILVSRSKQEMGNLLYPRAKAYTICDLYEILKKRMEADESESPFNSHKDVVKYIDSFVGKNSFESIFINHADSLVDLYETNHNEDWNWFELTVTYTIQN